MRLGVKYRTGLIADINENISGLGAGHLIDLYGAATCAYSCARKLRSAYSGSAIRVRRASDNTEQDIGFDTYGELDEASLISFCGSGNSAYVKTLYDQSANGYDLTQTTAANQPQIVSNGVVLKKNGRPCMVFDGSTDCFTCTTSTLPLITRSQLVVAEQAFSRNDRGIISLKTSGAGNDFNSSDAFVMGTTNAFVSPKRDFSIGGGSGSGYDIQKDGSGADVYQHAIVIESKVPGEGKLYVNGTLVDTDSSFTEFSANNTQGFAMGARYFNSSTISEHFNGIIQEYIYWPTSNAANIDGITANVNRFYNVY